MSNPAQVGKREFNSALTDARNANRSMRQALERLVETNPSVLVQALINNCLIALLRNEHAIQRLDEIGRNRTLKTETRD